VRFFVLVAASRSMRSIDDTRVPALVVVDDDDALVLRGLGRIP
jgi:hypothetical protein